MDINHVVRLLMLSICVPWIAKSDLINVDTNRPYRVVAEDVRSSVVFENSNYTIITNATLNASEIRIISALAEIYTRRIALKEYAKPVMQTDSSGRKFMVGFDYWRQFPVMLPDEFMVYGSPYDKLEMTIVPYMVRNSQMSGFLKGVLCEYRLNGEFRFGLYVCLNTYKVSTDFWGTSLFLASVSRLVRFPYLHNNIKEQKQFSLYVNKLGVSSEGYDRHKRKEGAILNNYKEDISVEVDI